MTSTESETTNSNLEREVLKLRKDMEVQAATEAGANATQVATHAGTWSAMIAGAAGLIVGMFLGITLTAVRPR
jgi:hypothetical protein